MIRLSRIDPTLLAFSIALLGGSCQTPEPIDDSPPRVENQELGIAIAALPEAFEIDINRGSDLRLTAPGPSGDGLLELRVGPTGAAAINLPAEAKATQQYFESLENGQYFGNLELVAPIGSAFTSRGAYDRDDGRVGEIQVFVLHPTQSRLLTLSFVYPEGEGKERMEQLALLLGEIEGLESRPTSEGSGD